MKKVIVIFIALFFLLSLSAISVIAAIFPVVLALIFQKYLVRGLTAGGVKG